jgi:predicted nucleic acid-binding protein
VLRDEASHAAYAVWSSESPLLSSRLTYVEARAAVAAARRSRRLSRTGHLRAREQLESLWEQIDVIELDAPLAQSADGLAEAHGLRAGDAVQLASALLSRAPVLATWDVALARAATEAGLAVAP